MAVGDVVDVGEGHAARRHRRQAPAERVAEHAVEPARRPGPGAEDAGRVADHDLDPALGLGEHELLGALLGALVGGALRVVGEPVLAHGAAALGVEDVEGRGVDDAPRAGLAGRGDDVARALGVDAVEDRRVGQPLLEDAPCS